MTLGERPIGDLVDKCHTWNPKASGAGSFDYIDLSSIDKDTKSIASIERHECSEAPSRARQMVEVGDVLVATVRPNLNGVALVNDAQHGMTASTGYCVLRPNEDKLDSRFLFHWVKTGVFVQRMVDVATGANYPAVSDAKVKASTIPLPPLDEQKRIAGILDAADALRAKRRESLVQLDTLLQSTFLDMFGDPVTNPMGWEVAPFQDCSETIFKGAFDLKAASYKDEGIPFIRIADIQDRTIDLSNAVFIDEETHAKYQRSELTPGDIVFSKVGTIDRIAAIPHTIPRCNCSQNNVGARLKTDLLLVEFALALLTTPSVLDQIRAGSKKAVQDKLVLSELRKLSVILPPAENQRHFAAIVESVEQQKVSQRAHLDELDTLFASLQSRAFKGEL